MISLTATVILWYKLYSTIVNAHSNFRNLQWLNTEHYVPSGFRFSLTTNFETLDSNTDAPMHTCAYAYSVCIVKSKGHELITIVMIEGLEEVFDTWYLDIRGKTMLQRVLSRHHITNRETDSCLRPSLWRLKIQIHNPHSSPEYNTAVCITSDSKYQYTTFVTLMIVYTWNANAVNKSKPQKGTMQSLCHKVGSMHRTRSHQSPEHVTGIQL